MSTGHLQEGSDSGQLLALAARLRQGDCAAEREIDELLKQGVLVLLTLRIGPDAAEVWLHETMGAIIQALKGASPSRPGEELRLVRSVLVRQAERIKVLRQGGCPPAPRRLPQDQERMNRAIRQLDPIEHEILLRLYVRRESPEEASCGMEITTDELEAVKMRAQQKLRAVWTPSRDSRRGPSVARLRSLGDLGKYGVKS